MDIELLETTLQPGKRVTHSELVMGLSLRCLVMAMSEHSRQWRAPGGDRLSSPPTLPHERIIQGVAGTWDRSSNSG
jgi:hypothetical protein